MEGHLSKFDVTDRSFYNADKVLVMNILEPFQSFCLTDLKEPDHIFNVSIK